MSNENSNVPSGPLSDFLTEAELKELLGLSKGALDQLRYNEELPYIKVNTRARVYYEPAIRRWLLGRQRPERSSIEIHLDKEISDPYP